MVFKYNSLANLKLSAWVEYYRLFVVLSEKAMYDAFDHACWVCWGTGDVEEEVHWFLVGASMDSVVVDWDDQVEEDAAFSRCHCCPAEEAKAVEVLLEFFPMVAGGGAATFVADPYSKLVVDESS